MYRLFNLREHLTLGVMHPHNWTNVKNTLSRNLSTVIRYYRRSPMAVPAQHFLVRLLQTIAVPQSLNTIRYYDVVSSMAMNHSMALKMTSSIYQGHVFKGVFYGEGCDEIIIALDDAFDPMFAEQNWENLAPVKVLRHPRSDLMMNLPDGKATGSETGLAVITVNVAMLAMQYRSFRNQEMKYAEATGDSQRSIYQFIHMYVLPNMLFSHLDYALFNRIRNLLIGAPVGESYQKHSFYISDYSDKVDDVNATILLNLEKVKQGFTGVLRNVPAVTKESMDQVLDLPQMAPTRQVIWALLIARLPALDFMLSAAKEYGISHNQQEINNFLRTVLSFRSNSLLSSVLPKDALFTVNEELNEVIAKTKFRA